MTTALVPTDAWALLTDERALASMERASAVVAAARLLCPAHLQDKPSDVLLVLLQARMLGISPVTALQSTYVIGGRVCWSSSFLIGLATSSGRFRGPIRWCSSGTGDELVVTAYATLAATGDEVSATVSMQMARAEGWANKNPKYRSMPELMLRYRSASQLVRLFCADILLGLEPHDDAGEAVTYEDPPPPSRETIGVSIVEAPVAAARPEREGGQVVEPPTEPVESRVPVPPPSRSSTDTTSAGQGRQDVHPDRDDAQRHRLGVSLARIRKEYPKALGVAADELGIKGKVLAELSTSDLARLVRNAAHEIFSSEDRVRKAFFASLSQSMPGYDYEIVAGWLESVEKPRPSQRLPWEHASLVLELVDHRDEIDAWIGAQTAEAT